MSLGCRTYGLEFRVAGLSKDNPVVELPRKDRDRDQDKKWNHSHGEECGIGASEQQQNIVDADCAGDPG